MKLYAGRTGADMYEVKQSYLLAVRTDMFGDTSVCDHVFIQFGFDSKHPGAHTAGKRFHLLVCQFVSA